MRESLQAKLRLFSDNSQRMKGKFIWRSTQLKRLAAMLYAAEDRTIDPDAIRNGLDLIKRSTGAFSSFRGNSAMSVAALLSLSDNKEERLANTLAVYDLMKARKFMPSDYLVVAAYQIAAGTTPDQHQQAVDRMKAFYDGMKAKHPLITGMNDYIYAAMLGMSNIDPAYGLSRIEQLYTAFKPEFHSRDGVQALAQILVLGGETADVKDRALAIRHSFRTRGIRLDRANTLASLGILTLLPEVVDVLVDEVTEAYQFLRTQPGFSSWTVSKQELVLLAVALVAYDHMDRLDESVVSTLSTSLTNMIIAQQAVIIAVVAASSSSAAAASASSSS